MRKVTVTFMANDKFTPDVIGQLQDEVKDVYKSLVPGEVVRLSQDVSGDRVVEVWEGSTQFMGCFESGVAESTSAAGIEYKWEEGE